MEGRRESQCSEGSFSKQTENSEENNDDGSKPNKGASSGEKDGPKTSSVRPYVRSKMPRLRWTPDLHLRFINAVERLGGQDRATPKLVLQKMNIKGLNIAHVKSHLQMYRSKKINNQDRVIGDHRHHFKSEDPDTYNLSQLPMLQGGYNHWHSGTFSIYSRDKDVSRSSASRQWMHNLFVNQRSVEFSRPGIYSNYTASKKVCSSTDILSNDHNNKKIQSEFTWTIQELENTTRSFYYHGKSHSFQKMSIPQGSLCEVIKVRDHSETSKKKDWQEGNAMKRKAVDYELDLDLSLKLKCATNKRLEDKDIDSNLSLSLCFPSSSNIYYQDG